MMNCHYKKYYLPGYTGHVPKKNEVFGMTAGQINRILVDDDPQGVYLGSTPSNRRYYTKDQQQAGFTTTDTFKFGNRSKSANTWVGGPLHEINPQHVPGYTGHIPSIKSEHAFAKSYAKLTASSITGKMFKGAVYPPEIRYKTITSEEFNKNNFVRLAQTPNTADVNDYKDFTTRINKDYASAKGQDANMLLTSKAATFNMDTNKTMRGSARVGDILLKSSVIEKNLCQNKNFLRLSDGFKKEFVKDKESMVVPIVGYRGHRTGYVARNMFGQSFRDLTMDSKRVERNAAA